MKNRVLKLIGAILSTLYACLMLFVVFHEKAFRISNFIIALGCVFILAFVLRGIIWRKKQIAVLIAGMAAISVGALLNGILQGNVHIQHHIVRLLVEAVLVLICQISF